MKYRKFAQTNNNDIRQLSISFPDDHEHLSYVDVSIVEEAASEFLEKRVYFEDMDLDCDYSILIGELENLESTPQLEAPYQDGESCDDTDIESVVFQDDLIDADEFSELEWDDEIIVEGESHISGANYEYDWESFEPIGVDFDEDVTSGKFQVLPGESKISKLQRARQMALQLGGEYQWDDFGIKLLTKIFYRYWWSATQRSLRRELEGGLVPIELELAEQAREIWYRYPEFSEAYKNSGEVVYKYPYLPWPSALALIRSFGSYPNIEEVEKLLLDIYEHWRGKNFLMQRFVSFRIYLD